MISLSLIWVLVTVAICIMLWKGVEIGTAGKIVLPKYVGSVGSKNLNERVSGLVLSLAGKVKGMLLATC